MKIVAGRSPAGYALVAIKGKEWFRPERLTAAQHAGLLAIVAPIFKHGGHGAVLDPSSAHDTENMTLTRAKVAGLRMRRGKPNSCHANAEALACLNGWKLFNGFARELRDAIWRPHSWAVDRSGRIVETTVRRAFYVGKEIL